MTEWIIYTAGMSSCWIIVAVTIERALLTLFPTTAKSKMTSRNALIVSVTLLISVALHNGNLLYAYTFTEVNVNVTDRNETKMRHVKSCSLRDEHTHFYNNTWSVMLFLTGSLLPIAFIVTGNAIVGICLIKRRRALQRIQAMERSNETNAYQRSRNGFSKKMFFVLSGVFIVTTVPYGVYFVRLEYHQEVSGHTLAKYQLVSVLMKCLVWSNFSFNFFLYFMTGTLFKKEFKKMLESARKPVCSITGRSTVHPLEERPDL
ncbi:uncharacterized protein LOC123535813 [Mercenaria mercenaria]|uniref:uncharacterized protein LOC123535813 n=1 Tax=Mercenaria mercenaria TaxID=6596 RepID=UPI00234E7B0E|nr:uncharacterized protein LOC123535813 [Mercenaria mercenaria]